MSNLIRGISENGGVVFCGVDSTDIVRKAEKLHTTSATCSAALGRLLTGATLMGSMLKDDRDRITLRVAGGGPAGVLIACTDGTGNVKGCIDNPLVELPAKANGHLDVGTAVGKDGVLTVIRDNRLQKEPTVGQVPLVSGEIAEDLTSYYAYSEQVPTVMALGVLVDKDLSILCAGGFMVQLLLPQQEVQIEADVMYLKRVLDNLFDNIRKYADPAQSVAIAALIEDGALHICLSNSVNPASGRIESNKIGLRTCAKIMTQMAGGFRRYTENGKFTAEVILPIQAETMPSE